MFGVSKPFDKVPYERLLKKLNVCRANGKSNSKGRKQRGKSMCINNGYLAEGYSINGEAPQISVFIPVVKEMH